MKVTLDIRNLNLSSLICNFRGNVPGFCGDRGRHTIRSVIFYGRTSNVLQDFGTSEVTFIIMQIIIVLVKKDLVRTEKGS